MGECKMKIMAINAGSSSLKFQLLEMPAEKVITKGLVERIGLNDSIFKISVNGEEVKTVKDIPNHSIAVKDLLNRESFPHLLFLSGLSKIRCL